MGLGKAGAQGAYLSQSATTAHFGLGGAVVVDTLEVTWPSGARQRRLHVAADRLVSIVEDGEPSGERTADRRASGPGGGR